MTGGYSFLGELEEEEKDEELEKRDKENSKRKREDVKVVVKVKGLASSIGWKDRAEAGRGEERWKRTVEKVVGGEKCVWWCVGVCGGGVWACVGRCAREVWELQRCGVVEDDVCDWGVGCVRCLVCCATVGMEYVVGVWLGCGECMCWCVVNVCVGGR